VNVDWPTVSSIATAAGTLVLAVATFASVRSASRAARVAERTLLAGLRPVLAPARREDPPQKVGFVDQRWMVVAGGEGAAEIGDGAIYLAIAVRNVGSGMAVLHGWDVHTERELSNVPHRSVDTFRRLTRDIYVPPGDVGFWQGAFRDAAEAVFFEVREAVTEPRRFTVDVLYGDHEGGQRAVTRFALTPHNDRWIAVVSRHWNVDRADPR
jgi:hypothetical protein